MNKRGFSMIVIAVIVILIVGGIWTFVYNKQKTTPEEIEKKLEEILNSGNASNISETTADTGWQDSELKDVKTGNKFKISSFYSKPILVESFAVWCPKCKQQQDELKKLKQEIGDSVVLISLDTDSNEDENKVLDHINRYGYDWYYAVSPTQVTQDLIDEFGIGIVNAPSTPIILICPKLQTSKLPSGIKSVSELKAELAKC